MSEQGLRRGLGIGLLATTLAAGCIPVHAVAEGPTIATREGNIWDWQAHQPTRGHTLAKEKAAGVALPAPQRHRLTGAVERLDRELLSRNGGSGAQGGAGVQSGK